MTAKTEPIREGDSEWTIEDLRNMVKSQLKELHVLIYDLELNGSIDIYAKDILYDLSYKLENVLYCESNCYYCVDPLKDAYDFARDIVRVGSIVHADDVAAIGERIAWLIYDYAQENEELWESDE